MAKKKLESTLLNMVLVLTLVTVISAGSLGMVYQKTKDKIAAAKEAKKLKAIQEVVLAGYNNSPAKEMYTLKTKEGSELEAYPAKVDGRLTSVAIKSYTKIAFSGEFWLMVGFKADGAINKVSVIEQKETPGLGTKIDSKKFAGQFIGKNPGENNLKVKKDGGIIDSITAATISSRAYSDAINRAYKAFKNSQAE